MDMRPEYRKKSIRSYVVRAGRMTDAQRNAFTQGWPAFGLTLAAGAINTDSIFGRAGPKILEIGFGMGDSLLQMAAADPETDFVGIEVHPPGVGTLINGAEALALKNLRVYLADAYDVLEECFGAHSIDRLQLYFPDPWHKKKHNKRRIIQADFISLAVERMAPDGIIHLATDWAPYAEHMLEVMEQAVGLENCAGSGQYSPRPDYRPDTKFERRGERLGHGVWDLLYRRR